MLTIWMLFGKPIQLRATHLPIFLSLIPTFFLMHSIGFCLSPLLICCFVDNKGVEYKFLMSSFEQNVRKTALSNWGPLFVMIARGILNRHTMFFQMNLETSLSLILTQASAFTHLLKQLVATSRNIFYAAPVGKGPTMSTPTTQMTKDL